MSKVKVIGISDMRGQKSKKTGREMDFAFFHCLTPLPDYPSNYGYNSVSLIVNGKLLNGVPLEAPANYDISITFGSNNSVESIKFLGKD